MGLYATVCARLSPMGVWFGTGLTVDGGAIAPSDEVPPTPNPIEPPAE